MKLKKDIELAQVLAKPALTEAKSKGDKEKEAYYRGLHHALNWICWDKKHGTDDLPL